MYETTRGELSSDTNDAQSVQSLVQKLQHEKYNPVLLYKEWRVNSDLALDLPAESFVLCLQTKHQKKLLQQFGANVLCMDSTHGTNQYDFKLITVMVDDHFGQGVSFTYYCFDEIITPVSFAGRMVGWRICSKEEKQFVQHF